MVGILFFEMSHCLGVISLLSVKFEMKHEGHEWLEQFHLYLTFGPTRIFFTSKSIYLLIPSPTYKHELGIIKCEPTNNKPPRPINICNQSRASVILCYGFCQPQYIE